MTQQSYDVIVVGAGPAGGTTAYELAHRGVQVLVLVVWQYAWGKKSATTATGIIPCRNRVLWCPSQSELLTQIRSH